MAPSKGRAVQRIRNRGYPLDGNPEIVQGRSRWKGVLVYSVYTRKLRTTTMITRILFVRSCIEIFSLRWAHMYFFNLDFLCLSDSLSTCPVPAGPGIVCVCVWDVVTNIALPKNIKINPQKNSYQCAPIPCVCFPYWRRTVKTCQC